MLFRDTGKLVFATIRDRDGQVQLFVSKAIVGDEIFDDVKQLDLGDWVGVHGKVMTTRTGELSIKVDRLQLLSKAVRPLPDKWHGLTDTDTRFRQRYADLIVNEEARRHFEIRHATVASFRRTLHDSGFVEVETPVLHLEAGGAHAKPFTTHHNAPRHGPLPPDRARAASQAADRGRHGKGVRDRPDLPQRGDLHPAQSRVHDDGAVPGVRRLDRRDGDHRAADHPGRPRRVGHDRRHDPRPAGRPRRAVAAAVDVRGGVREGRRSGPSIDGDRRRVAHLPTATARRTSRRGVPVV